MDNNNLFIPRSEDIPKFEELIQYLMGNKCIAFVGAGVSVNKGYRKWKDVIYDASINGKKAGLLEHLKISKDEIKDLTSLPSIVDYCHQKSGDDKYFEFIEREYERKEDEISYNHLHICRTNFKHIITTNFDPCLYDNALGLIPQVKTYPGNSLLIERDRTLYHIHGRAFLIKDENPVLLKKYLDTIVFGAKSFLEAYSKGLEIKPFIYSILKQYKLLFVGFSMDDEVFEEALKVIAYARERFNSEIANIRGIKSDSNIGYILLSYPIKAIQQMNLPNKNINFSNDDKNEKIINEIKEFNSKEAELNSLGIKVIGFDKKDESFKGLTYILQTVEKRATLTGVYNPLEKLDASLTASSSGSII